jgi:hypothetical protein
MIMCCWCRADLHRRGAQIVMKESIDGHSDNCVPKTQVCSHRYDQLCGVQVSTPDVPWRRKDPSQMRSGAMLIVHINKTFCCSWDAEKKGLFHKYHEKVNYHEHRMQEKRATATDDGAGKFEGVIIQDSKD